MEADINRQGHVPFQKLILQDDVAGNIPSISRSPPVPAGVIVVVEHVSNSAWIVDLISTGFGFGFHMSEA